MKESINLFLKLSEDTQNKIKKIYADSDISYEDRKIFDKLFSKVNLCKNISDSEKESIFNNYSEDRDITIGDIILRKSSGEIGTVENFENYTDGACVMKYAVVCTNIGTHKEWALTSNIKLLNKYSIGTSVFVKDSKHRSIALAEIIKVYCVCKLIYYDINYINYDDNIHRRTKVIPENNII